MKRRLNIKDRNIFYILFACFVTFLLWNYKLVLQTLGFVFSLATPFYIAIIIAFVINIPMSHIEGLLLKLQEKRQKALFSTSAIRGISIFLTLLITVLVILILSSFILPEIAESINVIFTNLNSYAVRFAAWVTKICREFHIDYRLTTSEVQELFQSFNVNSMLQTLGEWLGANTSTSFTGLINSISGTALTAITSIFMSLYLLASKEKYIGQFRKFIIYVAGTDKGIKTLQLIDEANYYMHSFLGGQFLEACIFMTLVYVAVKLFGLPFAELIAISAFIFSFIPMFGSFITLMVGIVLVAAADSQSLVLFIILYILIQQFEGNVVYPRVVGKSVGISGLYVLLGITIFGNLFGVAGVLMGVPVTAMIYALCSRIINISLYRQHIDVTSEKIIILDDEGEDDTAIY